MKILLLLLFFCSTAWGAWTSVGNLLSKANPATTDPMSFATEATLEAGNVAICAISENNDGDGTDDNDIIGFSDDAGNTWTSLCENEIDPGTAGAGVAMAIFFTKATTQLDSGSNITVDFAAARASKAISCWEFTVTAGATVAEVGTEQLVDDAAADATTLTLGSLSNAEHLWVRAVGSETNVNDFSSATGGFSTFTSTMSYSGTKTNGMAMAVEFIIATATTQTSDPTMPDTADRASCMVAIDQTDPAGGGTPVIRRRILISE